MKTYAVAVVGATGLVGQKMIQVLQERNFPVGRFVPVASQRSAGETVLFRGKSLQVQSLDPEVFKNVDLAFFSAGTTISRRYVPMAVERGVIVIDNSSAWRMEPHVPLVVPEVNREVLKAHRGVIANPNCSTIQLVVVIYPLHLRFTLRRVVVATYQAVTGSGKQAVQQLKEELQMGKSEDPIYPHPIAFNCLPHIDEFLENGNTREEQKMIQETRKIMADDGLRITATAVRVPVLGGHCEAVNIEFEKPLELGEVYAILQKAPGVVVQDDPQANLYPMPLTAGERDEVFVGRIRRDSSLPSGLNLWIVSDNLRKGAATNAIQIAETLQEMGLMRIEE